MAAAGHQIRKTDLINLSQVHTVEQIAPREDFINVQLYPADIVDREFIGVVVRNGSIGMITYQPSAIRKLVQRTDLMETRYFAAPADFCTTCEIDVTVLLAYLESILPLAYSS